MKTNPKPSPIKPLMALFALAAVACGGNSAPPDAPPAPDSQRLSGNVDVRPYTAHVAYATRREDNGEIDIKAYDRPTTRSAGCLTGEQGLVDTQRTVLVQMPWPVQPDSIWSTIPSAAIKNSAGVHFMVRRGLGGTGTRASGLVRVVEVSDTGGVLHIDAATPNKVGGVHGTVSGLLPFTICGDDDPRTLRR